MKIKYTLIFIIVILGITQVKSQEDSTAVKSINKKKNWSFGVLPTITYNSDLGFQYGGLIDLYNYGEGDIYPKYYERVYVEFSKFTKGSGRNNLSFESNRLFKGRTVFFDIYYQPDEQYDFLGINGYESVYNKNWEDRADPSYKSKMFYKNQTKRLRVKADILTPITDVWSWSTGVEFYNYNVNTIDTDRYNKGISEEDKLYDTEIMPGLWDRYKKWGILDEKTADGGSFLGLKAGLMFDNRDNWSNPSKGIWSEAILLWVPPVTNEKTSFLKLNITHRQYFELIKDRLTLAYRLGYSGNIVGDEPMYARPIMYSVMLKNAASEGLGGQRTIRGVRRNRVVGDGEAYGNIEFRYVLANFILFKQNWQISTNMFLDAGQIVQFVPLKEMVDKINKEHPLTDKSYWGQYAIGVDAQGNSNGDTIDDYFNFGQEKLHVSYGLGLRFIMNENFIVSIDYGKTTNIQDGPSGLYIGLGYTF